MKKLYLALLLTNILQVSAQKTDYKLLAEFTDQFNCPVTLTKEYGIYTVVYMNYNLLGSGFHDGFTSRDKKMLKTVFATVCMLYQDRDGDAKIYRFQIAPRHSLFVKKKNENVYITKSKEDTVFFVSEETAMKLLEALK